MTSERNSYQRKRLRSWLLARWRPGDPCPRCGQPMWRIEDIDMGHVVPRAIGGTFRDGVRLEHRSCNRRQGQQMTARLLAARGVDNRPWKRRGR